jgi:nucleoside-diphosphate-sugar epimerase
MRVLLAGAAGADGIVMDGLDRASVGDALAGVEPEVVIHQLTALATMGNLKKFDEEFAETNRLRTTGTDHLLAASRAAGVKRFIAQSYTGWPERTHRWDAIRYVEEAVTPADGPGRSRTPLRQLLRAPHRTRRGRRPVEDDRQATASVVGGGVWSFCHIDDAALATVAAVRGVPHRPRLSPGLPLDGSP